VTQTVLQHLRAAYLRTYGRQLGKVQVVHVPGVPLEAAS
jgi:hypothetical protein